MKEMWYALDVEVEPPAAEAVEYALIEAGSSGTERGGDFKDSGKITGYFDHLPDRERIRNELLEALRIYQ